MKNKRFLALIPLFFLVSSCQANSSETTVPTITKNIVLTNTPTLMQTDKLIPTFSPPTPEVFDSETYFEHVQNNWGCKLPCLFGLNPGLLITDALDSLTKKININATSQNELIFDENPGGFSFTVFQGEEGQVISISHYQDDENKISQLVMASWPFQRIDVNGQSGNKILYDDKNYNDLMKYFSLSTILSTYGVPSQILIAAFPIDPDHPNSQYPFDIVLFYPDNGFLVEYISLRETSGNSFTACPTKSHIYLSTWSTEKPQTLFEAIKNFSNSQSINSGNYEKNFKQLQDVTSLYVDDFYNIYSKPNVSSCLSTDQSIWTLP